MENNKSNKRPNWKRIKNRYKHNKTMEGVFHPTAITGTVIPTKEKQNQHYDTKNDVIRQERECV